MAKKKAAAKKTAAKKVASKKKVAAKKASAKTVKGAPKKLVTTAIAEPMTKTQMYTQIGDDTGLSKKEITAVFDSYTNIIDRHVKKRSGGIFKMPGLFKIKVVKKPAQKARKGINPFNGEEMMFKAKPARNIVKILPLKALKDMV